MNKLFSPLLAAADAGAATNQPNALIKANQGWVVRFEEATGTTPKDWVINQRLSRARELLEGSDMAVERVATECGFGRRPPESVGKLLQLHAELAAG